MESVLDNEENVARGCVILNDKIYPTREGHNTIGRNPDAIINIKNLSVSKHHAVITVFDENAHYISDLKSSNGTILDNNALTPLQLYKLDNGASIKFGEVFCTYKKFDSKEVIRESLENSEQCSENFYAACTQEVRLPNAPEGINFNEMCTQILPAKGLSINEMPTQIFSFSDHDDSSNDSIDFVTMKKATESQALYKNVDVSENKISPDTSSQNLNAGSDTDDDLDAVVKASLESFKTPEVDHVSSTFTRNSPQKCNDCETDDEPPLSQIQPVKTGKKNVIDSDSDTEEYVQFPQNNRSKYHISDDSETDIEENDDKRNNLEPMTQNDQSKTEETLGGDLKLIISESAECGDEDKIKEPKKINQKVLPQDHLYCQSLKETQDTQHVELSEKILGNSKATEDKNSKELSEVASGEITQPAINESIENLECSKNAELEDSLDEPPEKAHIIIDKESEAISSPPLVEDQNEHHEKRTDFQSNEEIKPAEDHDITGSEDKVDIFLQSTETLDFCEENPEENLADLSKKKETRYVDEMFLQPTQVLDTADQKTSKSSSADEEDEIFLQPTQSLENLQGETLVENNNTPSAKVPEDITSAQTNLSEEKIESASSVAKENEDELSLPPTQALEFLHRDDNLNKNQSDKLDATAKSLATTGEEDDLFLPPTQDLERLLSDDHKAQCSSKSEGNLFFQPEPFKTPSPLKKGTRKQNLPTEKEDDDSFILQPTQALEVMHKDEEHFNKVEDQLHEIFASQSLLCTQQLVDVLEVSSNDIIDDSIIQEPNISPSLSSLSSMKTQPMSVESVKAILDEGLGDGEKGDERRSKSVPRTYSKRKDDSKEEEEKIQNVEKSDADKIKEGVIGVRRGRSAQNLATGDQLSAQVSKDDDKTNKAVNNKGITRKTRSKKTLTSSNDQVLVDSVRNKDVTVEKERNENKDEDSKENEENTRQQTITDSLETAVDADRVNSKTNEESTSKRKRGQRIISKNEDLNPIKENKEGNKGRGKRRQLILSDENESSIDSTNNSHSSSNDGSERSKSRGKIRQKEEIKIKETEKEESQPNEEVKGRGRRKQNLIISKDQSSNSEKDDNSLSSASDDTGKSRKGRKKRVASPIQEAQSEEKDKDKSQNEEETKGRGRRKQSSVPSEVKKDDSQTSSNDSEGSRRRGKRQNTFTSSVELKNKENTPKIDGSTTEASNKRTKRKKDGTDKVDETPTKKKTLDEEKPNTRANSKKETSAVFSTPRKRASDYEDDFATKVPKIETPLKKSARLRKAKKIDENEEVITLTPISSKPETIISISSSSTIEEPAKKHRRLSANSKRQKKEEEEKNKQNKTMAATSSTPVLSTPERSRRVLKPKVVFTMMDNPELESLIRQLGGSVVDSVDACTVLVTQSVKRSLKLLCAVAQGKPVCSPEWLYECKRKSAFVDPWEYVLVDEEAEKKWNFSLRESINRSTKTKLLENYTFQLIVNSAADVLKGAIESCGGKCVTRNLPKCDTEHLIIVSSENNRSKFNKIVKQNPKILVVEAEAVFDGTLRQEFRFNDHLIT